MKNRKLWLGFAAALLLAAVGIALAYVWWLADPVTVRALGRTATVERGPLEVSVSALGAVAVPREQTLSFGVGGEVTDVGVTEGETVQKGDVLAQLDAADLQMRVETAEAALVLSEANLARTQAGPTEAELIASTAALAAAEARYDQIRAGPLEVEVASVEAALKSAQATYDRVLAGPTEDELAALKANVDRAQIALKQAQANYDRFAWREGFAASPQAAALEDATISYEQAQAAYNLAAAGSTTERRQQAAAEVARARAALVRVQTAGATDEQKTALAEVTRARAALDRLQNTPTPAEMAIARAQVTQAEIQRAQAKRLKEMATLVAPSDGTVLSVIANAGQSVSAVTPAIVLADLTRQQVKVAVHESHIARVQEGQTARVRLDALPGREFGGQVAEIAPVATVVGSLVNYVVTLDLQTSDPTIRPGMMAEAEIVVVQKPNVLLVAKGALRLRNGQWTARVVRDGQPEDVPVEIGDRQGRLVEVSGGVGEGDQLLLNTSPLDVAWSGPRPWRFAFGI